MTRTADATLVVIPARYPSTRFPGKPLADLNGKPMIQHVWERAIAAKRPGRVLVATDDERIAQAVRRFGGEVMMTSADHRTGTERVAEVSAQFPAERVVNLQGDLPLFQPATLDRLIETGGALIQRGEADLITAKSALTDEEELFSPHSVKVVTDERGDALYFSRSPIPHIERGAFGKRGSFTFYKHYGIYLYHKNFLLHIAKSPEGNLERMERLEQLRVLEQGGRVRVMEIEKEEALYFWEVNTPEDLVRAREILNNVRGEA
ncbi:MAG: 3-deoxy-manno-octulosonate cytidylyltransferase [Candidatus Manganitrophaceae bacterium]|nr:MAG: 3-deoxy-manno-octulosonate cytidylyltransferase [Candidatus Manganitrophaceae bacterium]